MNRAAVRQKIRNHIDNRPVSYERNHESALADLCRLLVAYAVSDIETSRDALRSAA